MPLQDIMELWRRLWEKFIQIAHATPTVEPNVEVEEVASTLYTLCQSKGTEEPDVSAPMYFLAVEVLVLLTETFAYSKLGKGPAECKLCEYLSVYSSFQFLCISCLEKDKISNELMLV